MTKPYYSKSAKDFASLVAITLLATLVVFKGLPNTTIFMHVLHKTGHPLAFGLMSLLVLSLLTGLRSMAASPAWFPYVAAFVITVAIGAATEIAQLFTHRDAQVVDVLRDAIGATACLTGHAAFFGSRRAARPAGIRLVFAAVALVAAIIAMAPLAWCLAAYAVRDAKFPVILENPSRLDMYFVSTEADNLSVTALPGDGTKEAAGKNDAKVVRVALDHGQYPGLSIDEPYPRWSGYRTLAVDIANPGQSDLPIVIRAHDRRHDHKYTDRFNRDYVIAAKSRTTILIPLHDIQHGAKGRLLDLDAIAGIIVFALGPVPDGAFFVSKIWLQ
jgi:VanZ family protein